MTFIHKLVLPVCAATNAQCCTLPATFCVSPELFPLMECSEEVKQLLLKLLWLLRPREAQSFARVSPTSPRHSASPYRVPKFNERTHSLIPNHCEGWRLGKIGQESICAIIIFFLQKKTLRVCFESSKQLLKMRRWLVTSPRSCEFRLCLHGVMIELMKTKNMQSHFSSHEEQKHDESNSKRSIDFFWSQILFILHVCAASRVQLI